MDATVISALLAFIGLLILAFLTWIGNTTVRNGSAIAALAAQMEMLLAHLGFHKNPAE